MESFEDDFEKSKRSRQRIFWLCVSGASLLVVIGGVVTLFKGESGPAPNRQEMIMVSLPPPPPPRATPPPATPPPREMPPEEERRDEMIVQEPVVEPEAQPEPETPDQPPDPGLLGTSITGDGPADAFGLSGSGSGGRIGGGSGRSGGGGSRWGWYAAQVQSTIADAMRRNPKTRTAKLSVIVQIWADSTGRVTRTRVKESSGDDALDAAIERDVLANLQLSSPPPEDMPMPINLRLNARRPK